MPNPLPALLALGQAIAQNPAPKPMEAPMTARIQGTFDVKLTPQPAVEGGPWAPGRMAIDKRYRGALEATGQGEMLAVRTATPGSAGYVAFERVMGTLAGRRGSFLLQHSGSMNRGTDSLAITVVPDSGTEELRGLQGRMEIIVKDGAHAYAFEYSFADAR